MAKRTVFGQGAHIVNSTLSAVGLTVSTLPERRTIEREIRDLLKKFEIQCVIDVGAHYGEFSDMLREVGYEGRIISFEPSEEAFGRVTEARRDDTKWEGHRMCLGDEDGFVEMQRFRSTDFNSLHQPTEYARQGRFSDSMESAGTERVPIRRLDEVLPELNIGSGGLFLKIDTQGHDLQVMRGAEKILPRVSAVMTELPVLRLYQGVPRFEEALAEYRKLGLLPVAFYPVTYDANGITVMEWDCLLTQAPAAAKDDV